MFYPVNKTHCVNRCSFKYKSKIMDTFETTLTGSDGAIDGIVTQISKEAYQFTSLDNSLHLTIAKAAKGKWIRLSGTDPYFPGWVDELSEAIALQTKVAKPSVKKVTATKKTTIATKKAAPAVTKQKAAPAKSKVTAPAASKSSAVKKTKPAVSSSKKAKVS
jgi:hypothetical protein